MPLASVALVVEVADTSREFDLGPKAKMYAGHRLAEYWVVDLHRRLIHQLRAPQEDVYQERREVPFGETIAAVTIPGMEAGTQGIG